MIPDAAIEAAAEALYVSFIKTTRPASRPSWSTLFEWAREDWRTDARAAIEAAIPAIEKGLREAIAQEIEAIPYSPELEHGDNGEWMQVEAARTARAAK